MAYPYDDECSDIDAALTTDPLDDVDILAGDDEMDGIFDSIFKAAKSVVTSPITKVIAGAAAIVCPPIGIPASAALLVADRAVQVAEGMRGTPKAKKIVKQAIEHTVHVAKTDPDAARMVGFMKLATRLREANHRKAKTPAFHATVVFQDPKNPHRHHIRRGTVHWA